MGTTFRLLLAVSLTFNATVAALAQENKSGNISATAVPVQGSSVKKPELNIPKLPINALTPADKNYGGTSIYLVDQKSEKKAAKQTLKTSISKPTQLPKATEKAKQAPKDAVLINSGEDAKNSQLVPQAFEQKLGRDGIDSARLIPAVLIETNDRKAGFRPIAFQTGTSVTLYIIQVHASRSDFFVFTEDSQAVSSDLVGDGNPILVGDRGTVVSNNDHLVTLHNGNLIVDSGSDPVRIANREMGAKLPPYSTVLVEYSPGKNMRILPLYLSKGAKLEARTASRAGETFLLSTQECLYQDAQGTQKQNFSADELSKEECFNRLLPSTVSYARLNSHLNRSGERLRTSPRAPKPPSCPMPLRVLAAAESEFYVDENGDLVLTGGWLCVKSGGKAVLRTDLGTVYLKKTAFVNLEQVPGYFRVASCSDASSVFACSGKYGLRLAEGEEVLFCDHLPSAAEIAAGDGILRRQLRSAALDNGAHAVYGEFSIYSLLYNAEHLRPLRLAATDTDRRIANSLIRTLSRIQFATATRGEYSETPTLISSNEQVEKPRATAQK